MLTDCDRDVNNKDTRTKLRPAAGGGDTAELAGTSLVVVVHWLESVGVYAACQAKSEATRATSIVLTTD